MAIVDLTKVGLYAGIQKRIRKSDIDFPLRPNAGVHAYPNLPNGIYKIYRRNGKRVQVCCADFVENVVGTTNQKAWWPVYHDAVLIWNSFTQAQKDVYIKKAYGKHYTGYNAFMKEYLLSH